ncbi:MAG: 4Fe-4S dicluster domain-containing protein [Clostridia bacterium]
MQRISNEILSKCRSLLEDGTADRVMAWENGEFCYDVTPAVFTKDTLDQMIYDDFCAANQSKYCIAESKKDGKLIALLKPCDTYSFNQLLKENRIKRENVYVLGVPCSGKVDPQAARELGIKGITGVKSQGDQVVFETLYGEKTCAKKDVLFEKCKACKGKKHMVYDALSDEAEEPAEAVPNQDFENRFAYIENIEHMPAEDRFAFWRNELSRCIRCNACRNVCPACSCMQCVFDNPKSGVASKANTDDFEENLFHIIRAFHVAGRCTDCGECTRVCPQNIPLHLLNRKFIKDINEFYGDYQAGADISIGGPLTSYTKQDVEPSIVYEKGGKK